jgi:hypothetical protein
MKPRSSTLFKTVVMQRNIRVVRRNIVGELHKKASRASLTALASLTNKKAQSVAPPQASFGAISGYRASGLMTVVFPSSVKSSFSCESRLLARSIASRLIDPARPYVLAYPHLPEAINSSSCSMLACSCLHQATKRSVAGGMTRTLLCQNAVDLLFRLGHSFFLPWRQSPQCRSRDEW